MTSGKTLKKIREKNNLTQLEVSKKLGFHVQYISILENDRQGFPVERFEQFMDAYGFTKKERVDFAVHLANMNRVLPQSVRKYLKIEGRV